MNFNLAFPFFRQARSQLHRAALWLDGRTVSYGELRELAQRIAAWLSAQNAPQARVGILASRTLETYAGILGACWSGAAYVPISPKLPEERLANLLDRTRLDALIVDAAGLDLLSPALLRVCPRRVLASTCAAESGASIQTYGDLPAFDPADEPRLLDEDALAYIIFTSGTTGAPKGVMISTGNVRAFIDSLQERFRFRPDDRVAQPSEVSFDNSVFDLFNAWEAGATLYVVPAKDLLGPIRFLRDNAITVWYSVPSFAVFMQRMKMLRPGALPALRYSAFAGEALPSSTAEAWSCAANHSILDCLYGPTETTVVCTGDRFSDEQHMTASRGIVSIGRPFPGMEAAIVDSAHHLLQPGQQGELAISGKQVAKGYFEDETLTRARFPAIGGRRWYLTGDLAYQDKSGLFHHLGRVDNQVKVLGNRVELEEVEAQLRAACGSNTVAAVAWPMQHGTAAGLVAFVSGAAIDLPQVSSTLRQRLPAYMIPTRIHELTALPMNGNGKTDRKALVRMLDESLI